MTTKDSTAPIDIRVKTARWLFYLSLVQVVGFFVVPGFIFPVKYLLYLEILAALTLGVFIALFFLAVNAWCLLIDRKRSVLYTTMIAISGGWIAWAIISWLFIEHMDYLLK
ncbi:MAG TPA: hypothetical protein VM118_04345 [Acidobacteriota bacterium]|nr:hypothetical protein [Acidobacteriota bacterium]